MLSNISTLEALEKLGSYSQFIFTKQVSENFTELYANVKDGDKEQAWMVSPIDGRYKTDIGADSFYVFGNEGVIGLLYKSREDPTKYRIVLFKNPLKRIPRISRKYKRRRPSKRKRRERTTRRESKRN